MDKYIIHLLDKLDDDDHFVICNSRSEVSDILYHLKDVYTLIEVTILPNILTSNEVVNKIDDLEKGI